MADDCQAQPTAGRRAHDDRGIRDPAHAEPRDGGVQAGEHVGLRGRGVLRGGQDSSVGPDRGGLRERRADVHADDDAAWGRALRRRRHDAACVRTYPVPPPSGRARMRPPPQGHRQPFMMVVICSDASAGSLLDRRGVAEDRHQHVRQDLGYLHVDPVRAHRREPRVGRRHIGDREERVALVADERSLLVGDDPAAGELASGPPGRSGSRSTSRPGPGGRSWLGRPGPTRRRRPGRSSQARSPAARRRRRRPSGRRCPGPRGPTTSRSSCRHPRS